VLKTGGPGALLSESRTRLARVARGRAIGNQFARFAHYRHADGEIIPLYSGYRDYLKPLHVLAHASVEGTARYVRDNRQLHVDASGLGGAANFLRLLGELGVTVAGKRVLDVGCGDGALAFLMSACGAEQVSGIELGEPLDHWNPEHIEILVESVAALPFSAIVRKTDFKQRVNLSIMDVMHPTTDGKFDLILSHSVLEHVVDLKSGLAAMTDLLNPHGTMVHVFNPFFSENGGHEWCILDFPWGHVRLTRDEIREYLDTYRGWEKARAIAEFDTAFNEPKLSLNEIDGIAVSLGLRCDRAMERRSFWWKPDSSVERMLSQCRRTYPNVMWADLTSDVVTRVWTKE
jgi:2-polyprenyl-3-methyl-5-hydroxy-6-metoxy-1,4-benzoquinol methylase